MTFPLDVIIASAARTPVGRAVKGALRQTRPEDLAATAMCAALDRVRGLSAADVDDVILGCAVPEAEQGLNIARLSVLLAKWPTSVPGATVNRFCASGLEAIARGALGVHAGLADVVVAGGVESMSLVPMTGNKISLNPRLVDELPDAYIAMGHTAQRVADRFEVSRAAQDAFAVRSHERALAALATGRFDAELVPVKARVLGPTGVALSDFSADECPRAGTTLEVLAKLKPAFTTNGSVSAGNSSPISDGAAAAVLLSQAKASELGVEPLGRLRAFTVAGVDPGIMGVGPVPAIRKLLARCNLRLQDVALFELNEAFAAQAVYCARELHIPDDRLNVNGGAIALGHPLGCTGAKLTATLLHELHKRGGGLGVVSMCMGGGMGAAALFEV